MATYSYESILRSVGRVLDDADPRSFAIRETENGLLVETYDENGDPQLVLDFGLADLTELIERHEAAGEQPHYERSYAHDDSTLRTFLERHELVEAGR
jgi:hypothetical protein